ncbi:histidine kinase [Nautilia profundicola AmH]|uniref:histidine kinase n=1 Tax=Nautilia profundicola (strain ATCC BAA-1463 / DSM 18972 / AmH) TaxID=598659 RepID=B9L5Q5_NAUPA|nr:HAMP domain-containing sensor histidine kinase [Nautilia profundicola]ACM92886.1 histidine kinase [Nautilia profundicola AmH]
MNFKFLDKLGFFAKTKLLIFVILFSMITIIVLSQYSIFTFKNDIDTLFQKRTVPVVKLENIKDLYKINVYETINQYNNNEINLKQAKEVISLAKELIEKEWKCYLDKQMPTKGFEALVIKNILKLKKRINEQIETFLKTSKVDFKELKNNINTINIYLSDIINSNIKKAIEQKNKTDKRFSFVIKASVMSIVVVFVFSITLMILIVENFKKVHIELEENVREKTKELEEINKNLEKRIKKAVEENRRKDKIMFQQSKLAAMGEMLQNIAHQWRQPLGSISLILQSIKLKNEMNKLTPEYIDKKTDEALILADNMSKTIDDFKNFFRPDKTKKTLSIKKCICHSKQLISHMLEKFNIKIDVKIKEDVKILGYKNELSHVCLNILNNAIDSLKNSSIENKKILIVVKKEKKGIIISIIDNGGGIKEEYLEKIFEPYFTTKLKDKGSGIGLYMAKQIIEEHMGGKIKALNIKHKMGTDIMYNCAMFEITLPIKDVDEKL